MSWFARHQLATLSLAVFCVSFVCRVPAVQDVFLWDDATNIQKNIALRNPASIVHLFTSEYFRTFREMSYRPVPSLTYVVDYWMSDLVSRLLFGNLRQFPDGKFFHFTNVLLNSLNAVLVFYTARILLSAPAPAVLAGTLFGIHAVQSEAVSVIAFREDLLCAFFLLIAVILFLHRVHYNGDERRSNSRPTLRTSLAVFCLILALFSKETALVAPLLFLAVEIAVSQERRPPRGGQTWFYTATLLACAGFAVLRLVLFRSPGEAALDYPEGDFWSTMRVMPAVTGRYLAKILFPIWLSPFWEAPSGTLFLVYSAAGAGLLVAVICAAVRLWTQGSVWAAGVAWFAIALAPVFQIVPIRNLAAERFLYIPMIGIALATAAGFARLQRRLNRSPALRRAAFGALILVLAFHATLCVWRSAVWGDAEAMPRASLIQNPRYAGSHALMGRLYLDMGEHQRAVRHYLAAAQLDPAQPGVLFNVARVYHAEGDAEGAEKYLQLALQRDPRYEPAWGMLAVVLLERGQTDSALHAALRAIELDPESGEAMNTVATIYAQQGDFDTAIEMLRHALRRQPGNIALRYNLGVALQQVGRWPDAARTFEAVILRSHSFMPEAHMRRAFCMFKLGRADEAERELRSLLPLLPDSALLRWYLAQVVDARGLKEQAKSETERALALGLTGREAEDARAFLRSLDQNLEPDDSFSNKPRPQPGS